ncbi:MAG: sigma-70 family RNA polymerase sigma factor [Planctomycetota bacterium]
MHPASNPSVEQDFLDYRSDGDPEAFRSVFRHAAPHVMRVARSLGLDAGHTDDLVQETFLFAARNADRFDAHRPLVPWLCGVAYRIGLDARRRDQRQRRFVGELDEPDTVAASAGQPEGVPSLEASELTAILEQTLQDLDEPYRQVLAAHLRECRSPTEIARRIGRSPSTVRTQIHRGLQQLRGRLPEGLALSALTAILLPPLMAGTTPNGAGASTDSGAARSLPRPPPSIVLGGAIAVIGLVATAPGWLRHDAPAAAPGGIAPPRATATAEVQAETAPPDRSTTSVATPVPAAPARADEPATASLRVRVVDRSTGQPVSQLAFEIHAVGPEMPTGLRARFDTRKAVTDPKGEAHFADLPTGWVRARFAHGSGSTRYQLVDDATIDLPVEQVVTYQGVVRTPTGQPAAGAEVWLARCGREAPVALADAAGSFCVRVAETESIALWARAAGLCSELLRERVGDADHRQVSLLLAPAPGAVTGRVFDTSGHPVAGAILVTTWLGPKRRRWPQTSTRSGTDGSFRLEPLFAGTYALAATAGARGSALRTVHVDALQPTLADLRLDPGATVNGHVEDSRGDRFQCVVLLGQVSAADPRVTPELLTDMVITGADGRFEFAGVAPGEVRLRVASMAGMLLHQEVRVLSGPTAAWRIRAPRGGSPADTLRQVADEVRWWRTSTASGGSAADDAAAIALGTVRGQVGFAPHTWPRLLLRLWPLAGGAAAEPRTALVDADGAFAFVKVPPGEHRLVVIEDPGLAQRKVHESVITVNGGDETAELLIR